MFLREQPQLTLADVADEWIVNSVSWGGGLHQVDVDLDTATPTIRLGEHEVRATKEGVSALANYLAVPVAFLHRLERDEQQWLLASRLSHTAEKDVAITYTPDGGITSVLASGQRRIEPAQIAEVALAVLPPEATVTDHWRSSDDLRLDVIVPDGFDRGVGGDPDSGEHTWDGEKRVGDITRGGVRLYQNRKQNLAPGVQPYLYRLVCTNGMEVPAPGIKVDARGLSIEEMLMHLRAETARAFARVEADIRSFYDLRSQRVNGDRTGELRRIALDAGLPSRTVGALEDLLPTALVDVNQPTMFDLVNLVTNYANNVHGGVARNLQRVGGGLVNDHTARCETCHRSV